MNEKKNMAIAIKEQTLNAVTNSLARMQSKGEIHFPADYSPQNALKQAWLILQDTQNKDKQPVLQACTVASINKALMDMVIQGLNPKKSQGYFIAYGNQLTFQRSYFGSMALAKRVNPDIADIVAEVVFEGDEFEYEIQRGRKIVAKHKQTLQSVDSNKVIGAYCVMYGFDGNPIKTDIMTYKEIQKAWQKSKMNPIAQNGGLKAGSTHSDYLAEMCRKTVINRCCKSVINASSDRELLKAINRSEFVEAEESAQEEIDQNANQEFIDVDPESEPDPRHKNKQEDPPPPEETETDEALERLIEGDNEQQATGTDGPGF